MKLIIEYSQTHFPLCMYALINYFLEIMTLIFKGLFCSWKIPFKA